MNSRINRPKIIQNVKNERLRRHLIMSKHNGNVVWPTCEYH